MHALELFPVNFLLWWGLVSVSMVGFNDIWRLFHGLLNSSFLSKKNYHVKFLPLWICFKLAFRNFLACFIQEVLMSFALGFRKVFVCFIHDELRISHEQCQLVCLCSVLILAVLCFALQRKESWLLLFTVFQVCLIHPMLCHAVLQ